MLGLNFNHLGNGFSYLGHGTRRLRSVARMRWLASFPNRASLIHPLLALSSTLKVRAELPLEDAAYLNQQLFFNAPRANNLARKDFHSKLFVSRRHYLVPVLRPVLGCADTTLTTQLNTFVRLSLIDAASFYLFLSLNFK